MLRSLLLAGVCCLLWGCGKGESRPSPPPQPSPPGESQPIVPSRKGLFYGYWYADEKQPEETVDHCNIIHIPFGGIKGLDLLRVAKNAGFTNAVISMDMCGFELKEDKTRVYYGDAVTKYHTESYLQALKDAGLLDMIIGMYTVDEPERQSDVPAEDLAAFCAVLRIVSAEFGVFPNLCVIYGDGRDYRAIDSHDWIGRDAYGEGDDALGEPLEDLMQRLRPDQKAILVPGGADPWRTNPHNWYTKAQESARVIWLCPFDWAGYDEQENGIRTNGMAEAYRPYGKAIKEA